MAVAKGQVRVDLLNRFRVINDAQVISFSFERSPKLVEALAFLALPVLPSSPYEKTVRRRVTREALIDLLWPAHLRVMADRNGSLTTLLRSLSRKLEAKFCTLGSIVDRSNGIQLTEAVTTDIEIFLGAFQRAKSQQNLRVQAQDIGTALSKVTGPLMPDLRCFWIEPERRLFATYLRLAVADLVKALIGIEEGAADVALGTVTAARFAIDCACASVISLADHQLAYCDLMRLHLLAGQPLEAMERYDELARSSREAQQEVPNEAMSIAKQAGTLLKDMHPGRSRGLLLGRADLVEHTTAILSTMPPLVTLTGPPGAGKTRVAEELFVALRNVFGPDRSIVRLDDVQTTDHLTEALAHQISNVAHFGHTRLVWDENLLSAVIELLKSAPFLLILDNFDHLLHTDQNGVAMLAHLLRDVPMLTCLVTSQERLQPHFGKCAEHINEIEIRVPPLDLPDEEDSFATTRNNPCVALFTVHAHAVSSDFYLTEQNVASVCRLCRLLDGLPLAIVLAAGWSRTHSPARMCKEIQVLMTLPLPNSEGLRYSSIQAVVDGSYRRLDSRSARLFASLSTFRGGWSLKAVQIVCSDDITTQVDIVERLTDLIGRSLVEAHFAGTERRFSMLHTLQEFAAGKLSKEEEEALLARHAGYFVSLLQEADPHLRGPEQREWWDKLACEQDNFRSALEWCLADPDERIAQAIKLIGYLWQYWIYRGLTAGDRAYVGKVLYYARRSAGSSDVAKVLNGAATFFHREGEYTTARALFRLSIRMFRVAGNTNGVASALHNVGQMFQRQHKWHRAHLCFAICLKQAQLSESSVDIAIELYAIGRVMFELQNWEHAHDHFSRALAYFEAAGYETAIASVHNELGRIEQHRLHLPEARAAFDQALSRFERCGDRAGMAAAFGNLGIVSRLEGNYALAGTFMRKSLAIEVEQAHAHGIAESLGSLSMLARDENHVRRSITLMGARDAIMTDLGIANGDAGSEEDEYRDHIVVLQVSVDEDEFRECYGTGRQMSRHRAIEYALHDN